MTNYTKKESHDVSILLAGQAGQGIMTIEKILTRAFKEEGFSVFATREYMSRVRGGVNSTQVRIADASIAAPVERVDVFVALDGHAFERYCSRLTDKTVIIGDKHVADMCQCSAACKNIVTIPLREIASDIGRSVYANTVAAGAILALLDVPLDGARDALQTLFVSKGQDVITHNITALERGYKHGSHAVFSQNIQIDTVARTQKEDNKKHVFMAGYEAVGLGALAGGVDFCTSYPMSPSTGVLTYIAQHGKECGVVVEQATDEIGAINMSLGASYAGARPIITTSGGGFALMEEAVSLAAMTETPVTVHIAQRPGPATGLPTRTAQEDLNLVLHAGHGEFARAIFAPGTTAEAFVCTQRAVALADAYQIPTFILTDQYFMDSLALAHEDDFTFMPIKKHIVETDQGYKRYALTENGITPRGIPGYGYGFVCADSDEHDESGHITEDLDVRVQMVQKRRKRLEALAQEALMPSCSGACDGSAKKALIVWGSNRAVAQEALAHTERDDVIAVHFAQVYPLNPRVKEMLDGLEKIAVMENNVTGQFADLLERDLGIKVDTRIAKYNGAPFTVEEVINHITQL